MREPHLTEPHPEYIDWVPSFETDLQSFSIQGLPPQDRFLFQGSLFLTRYGAAGCRAALTGWSFWVVFGCLVLSMFDRAVHFP